MGNYAMTGKFITTAEDRDKLIDILVTAGKEMQENDDCLLYLACKDEANDDVVWVMELWTSKEAHDESLAQPQTRELIGKALPVIKGTEGASLIPVGGKGLSNSK